MLNTKSKIFRYFLVCFIFGIGIASFFTVDYFYLYLLVLASFGASILFWKNKPWCFLFLGGAIIALGIFRYQLSLPKTNEDKIWFYNGQKTTFLGMVIIEPDRRISQTKLTVEASKLKEKKVQGKVLVSVGLYPEYDYGDLLEITCNLKVPEPFEDFAYDRYLAKDDVYSRCSYPKIKLISHNNGDWLITQIYQLKNKLQLIINQSLPEPQASLFSAIILGARRGLPQDLLDKFNITGTTHLIAISGLNITIITAVLMDIFLAFYISRKKSFWLITIILIFYMILIGAPASAVRSAVMGWLYILARYVGRLNKSANALLFAASAMILLNPKILRDDAGFQLSFLAVLGLIYFSPLFANIFKKFPSNFGLKEALQTTLAAQLSTMPLIIYSFSRFSLIGPVTNLLVVPISAPLTIFGTLSLILALIFPNVAFYFFLPHWLMLTYIIKVVEILAAVPLAAINF